MSPPPAKTFLNSLSGIDAISESMVEMNVDAWSSECDNIDASSGSHRFSAVDSDCCRTLCIGVGANASTTLYARQQPRANTTDDCFILVLFCQKMSSRGQHLT